MAYDNELSGMLSRNTFKKEDKHPDHTGTCQIDGKEYRIAAWIKTAGENSKVPGQKFFSLAFSLKEEQQPAQDEEANAPPPDDDIPF